ncbi:MAG: hypothetical protein OWT28_00795 [Firmicutes bacterium]|nr:hypothetical protein [Bacillota bacterium]
MSLLAWSYGALGITALTGLGLFLMYTFRARTHLKPIYPLIGVRVHLVFVAITAVLLTLVMKQKLTVAATGEAHYPQILLISSYVMFWVTLILGLYFYFRFDVKRIRLRSQFLVTHWVLAALSFIFLTSSFALYSSAITQSDTHVTSDRQMPVRGVVELHREMREIYLKDQTVKG